MNRSLAIVCLAGLVCLGRPVAAVAANITHEASNKYFCYESAHPIGGSPWSHAVSPVDIPGGTNPSNAVLRLTDDTRLAFVGAFDAYFRRLMASVAFGTSETHDYSVFDPLATNTHYYTDVDLSTLGWKSESTIKSIFGDYLGGFDGWVSERSRNYAITNVYIAVTNVTGFTPYIVTLTNGQTRIAISNNYVVTQKSVPDTTRIVDRYVKSRDHMIGLAAYPDFPTANPNGIRGLMRYDAGYVWPRRNRVYAFGTRYYESSQKSWHEGSLYGWTWSQAKNFTEGNIFGISTAGDFRQRLPDCLPVEDWSLFLVSTWDIIGQSGARENAVSVMEYMANDLNGLFGYVYNSPAYDPNTPEVSEWDACLNFIRLSPNFTVPDGEAGIGNYMLTNLVDVYESNATNVAAIQPDHATLRRIYQPQWALTDSFLALTDTAIVHPMEMPHFKYDWIVTNGAVSVLYHGPYEGEEQLGLVVFGEGKVNNGAPYYEWSATGRVNHISRKSQSVQGYSGARENNSSVRRESAIVEDPVMGFIGFFNPKQVIEDPTDVDAGYGVNIEIPARNDVREWISRLAAIGFDPLQQQPVMHVDAGDVVFLDVRFAPGEAEVGQWTPGYVWEFIEGGVVNPYNTTDSFAAETDVGELFGSKMLIIEEGDIKAGCFFAEETTVARRPFERNFNKSQLTNSVPCSYPHPAFAGIGKVEEVASLIPTAFAACASTTNVYYNGPDDWGHPGGEWGGWDDSGYGFAFLSDTFTEGNATARSADGLFEDMDDRLDYHLKGLAKGDRGVGGTANMDTIAAQVTFVADGYMQSAGEVGLVRLINRAFMRDPQGIAANVHSFMYPNLARITSISPAWDDDQGDWKYNLEPDPGKWFDVQYEVVTNRLATDSLGYDYWEFDAINGDIAIRSQGSIGFDDFPEDFIPTGGKATIGGVTGYEEVIWDFDTMKRVKEVE